jgi:PAS domain S-box-containing protein
VQPLASAAHVPNRPTGRRSTTPQSASAIRALEDRWTWFNRRWCEIVGFSREELLDRNLSGLTHPEDFKASAEFDRRVRIGDLDRGAIEKRYVRKDGVSVWTQLTMSIVRNGDSGGGYCIAFLDDITARKKAEQRVAAQFSVARILGEAPDATDALRRVIDAMCAELDWNAGSLWTVDEAEGVLKCVESRRHSKSTNTFKSRSADAPLKFGQGLPGRVWSSGAPAWIEDVGSDTNFPRATLATSLGIHGAFAFPVKSGNTILGVMEFFSPDIQPPTRSCSAR